MKTHRLFALVIAFVLVGGVTWGFRQQISSGVEMTRAAEKYLASLSEDQRAKSNLKLDIPERVDWHFIPKPTRKGLQIREMDERQREAAHTLLRSALSEIGYDKATKIMEMEKLLHELEKNKTGGPLRDSERYFFTIFGKPAKSDRWGLSVEGHHLSLNFVVENGKVVSSTPTAFAANPATVKSEVAGNIKPGARLLANEEQQAFDLLAAFTDEQRKVAIISSEAPREVRAAGEPQPPQDAPVGLAAAKMSATQRGLLQSLLATYANNLADEVAKGQLEAIAKSGIEKVHFAWAGAVSPGVGHYYRVQGPTFLIEFVNTQPDAAGNPANHIHCVWRDPKGDFAIPVAAK